jgi:hypothetical protein
MVSAMVYPEDESPKIMAAARGEHRRTDFEMVRMSIVEGLWSALA